MAHRFRQGHKAETHGADEHGSIGVMSPEPPGNHDDARMEAIRLKAFVRWEKAGKPEGKCLQFWLDAEKDLALSND